MSNPIIIDRRKNPSNKNLSNRQRFLGRYREQIKEAAKKHVGSRKIADSGGQEITIPVGGIDEPHFRHNRDDGQWDYIVPGNKEFLPGDHIDKPPPNGGGGGGGKEGGINAEGQDEFQFLLSYDEFLDVIFDNLELPDLIKKSEKLIESHTMRRAGFTTAGIQSNLNVERTLIAGLSRRIALKNPKIDEIEELKLILALEEDEEKKLLILERIELLMFKTSKVGFLDNVDLRYNNFVPQPRPYQQAVMFCVMDISYSMGEHEKAIAKKFFLLLHLFLKRRYKNIEIVFVRHHEKATECDEEEFFTKKETGGTVVSSAFEIVDKVIKDRYNPKDWNIYIAQASDGDNYSSDSKPLEELYLKIMPLVQFLAYIEISSSSTGEFLQFSGTNLWTSLWKVKTIFPQIELQKIFKEADIVSVFRKFFSKE